MRAIDAERYRSIDEIRAEGKENGDGEKGDQTQWRLQEMLNPRQINSTEIRLFVMTLSNQDVLNHS